MDSTATSLSADVTIVDPTAPIDQPNEGVPLEDGCGMYLTVYESLITTLMEITHNFKVNYL